mmetsp:Transcript_71036/g.183175  ORF Transcript_71036/g.183175 Transcript_71036/m.183175 type:complete len:369 (+) Transcript_71036:121-1227(+)
MCRDQGLRGGGGGVGGGGGSTISLAERIPMTPPHQPMVPSSGAVAVPSDREKKASRALTAPEALTLAAPGTPSTLAASPPSVATTPAEDQDSSAKRRTPGGRCIRNRPFFVTPLLLEEDLCAPRPPASASAAPQQSPLVVSPTTLSMDTRFGGLVRNTFIHAALPPPTPPPGSAAASRSRSVPRDLGSSTPAWETEREALGSCRAASSSLEERDRDSSTGVSEDAKLDVSVGAADGGAEASAARAPTQPMLTPSTFACYGLGVQNTFIHAALPPPTPPAGSSCRSQSAPRTLGREDAAEGPQAPRPRPVLFSRPKPPVLLGRMSRAEEEHAGGSDENGEKGDKSVPSPARKQPAQAPGQRVVCLSRLV